MDRLGQSHPRAKYHSIGKESHTLSVRVPQANSFFRKNNNQAYKNDYLLFVATIRKGVQENFEVVHKSGNVLEVPLRF